jgi:uncharacterized repeat protein (TIGR03803 family)
MTSQKQRWAWISKTGLGAANAALALAAVLGLGMVATQPALAQTFTQLYSFSYTDGSEPFASLFRDQADNLYGTTAVGGSAALGTVFKLDTSGNETVLYNFTGGAVGGFPYGALVGDTAGNLYGTTAEGGDSSSYGVVFKLDSGGTETVLHTFTGERRTGVLPKGDCSGTERVTSMARPSIAALTALEPCSR